MEFDFQAGFEASRVGFCLAQSGLPLHSLLLLALCYQQHEIKHLMMVLMVMLMMFMLLTIRSGSGTHRRMVAGAVAGALCLCPSDLAKASPYYKLINPENVQT